MHLDRTFRLSFYATIVMAFACLGYAELWFLPWIGGLLAVALVLIGVAYRFEGRWMMSERWANRIGIGIALTTVLWISLHVPRSDEDLLRGGVPWPAGILPHVGPLLMILLLVKLFRPKPPADVWVIHVIALMMVLLACVLTGDFTFGFLLLGYLACLLWSVSVYYQVQGGAFSTAFVPARHKEGKPQVPWHLLGIGKATLWTLTALALSLLVFLIIPRQDSSQWDPTQLSVRSRGRVIIQTGMDSHIDSGRTGKVEVVDEIAFHVEADDAKGPKLDLDSNMRWRGHTLDCYTKHGRWRTGSNDSAARFVTGYQAANQTLPSLDPAEFYLNIRFEAGRGVTQVLADPPVLGPKGEHPYVILQPVPRSDPPRAPLARNLFNDVPGTGTFHPVPRPVFTKTREYLYRQVVRPAASAERLPADGVSDEYREFLLEGAVPAALAKFTQATLENLDELRDAEVKPDGLGRLPPRHYSLAAKALENHLANSGDYKYSLTLERVDRTLDPTVDFLLNVKKGHCERYAGALTLMLRSLGIPSRIVKGYRGVDGYGDGTYFVKQSQAHAWVEALVPDDADANRSNWLVLDPTPANNADDAGLDWMAWLSLQWRDTRTAWRNFILEYDTERQQAALRDLWRKLTRRDRLEWWSNVLRFGGVLVGVGALFWVGRRIHIRRQARRKTLGNGHSQIAFYDHFLKTLRRHTGLQPKPTETPHEFAQSAAQTLNGTCRDLAKQVVALLYRVRFGGETLLAAEARDIDLQIQKMSRELKATGVA